NKNQFTKSEHKIFHYITNNFEAILYKSLTEIANGCHVGEATVLRFYRKLGFKGYQDFKLSLARELSTHQKSDQHETYISKVRNIEVVTDSHNQMIRSNSVDNETVIIAISLTGSTKDIIDAVENSKQNGAKVIAITNYTESPLAEFADIILLTSAKENPLDSGSLVSKISQLYIIDLLCTGITIEDHEKAKKTKELVAETISSKLY